MVEDVAMAPPAMRGLARWWQSVVPGSSGLVGALVPADSLLRRSEGLGDSPGASRQVCPTPTSQARPGPGPWAPHGPRRPAGQNHATPVTCAQEAW